MNASVSPWQLLSLYQLTILAGLVTAAALAWLGAHLAAQARSAQTLCVGQGASLGVLIGMILVCQFQSDEVLATSPWPLVSGTLVAAAIYAFGNRLNRNATTRNVNFIALFAVLWSLSPLLSGLFPKIDDHLTQVYFGDLVTLSERNSELALVMSALMLLTLWRLSPRLNALSFNAALTGSQSYLARTAQSSAAMGAFDVLVLVLLCFSIQFLGLLFTLGCLFVPTVMLARGGRPGSRRHFRGVTLVASLGCFLGFVLSLTSARLSTVPTVLVCMSAIGGLVRLMRSLSTPARVAALSGLLLFGASASKPVHAAEFKPKYGPKAAPLATPLSADSTYFRNPKHAAPDFWALIPFYVPQFHGAACSVAAVTMTLNAAIAQRAVQQGPLSSEDPNVEQKALLDRVKAERWKERILGAEIGNTGIPNPTLTRGMTLDQLTNATEAAFKDFGFKEAKATLHRFEKNDPKAHAKLLALLKTNERTANDFLIANFDQKQFTDDAEVGHISPIGAFDAARARVLILESDREYYEPYWVSVDTLLTGIQTLDRTSGKLRGLVHVQVR